MRRVFERGRGRGYNGQLCKRQRQSVEHSSVRSAFRAEFSQSLSCSCKAAAAAPATAAMQLLLYCCGCSYAGSSTARHTRLPCQLHVQQYYNTRQWHHQMHVVVRISRKIFHTAVFADAFINMLSTCSGGVLIQMCGDCSDGNGSGPAR